MRTRIAARSARRDSPRRIAGELRSQVWRHAVQRGIGRGRTGYLVCGSRGERSAGHGDVVVGGLGEATSEGNGARRNVRIVLVEQLGPRPKRPAASGPD